MTSLSLLATFFLKNVKAALNDSSEDDLLFKLNENQKLNAVDLKSNWIIDIEPAILLKMTTPNFKAFCDIVDEAKPLEFYLSEEINKGMTVHPFLQIDKETGKIVGHEARHRACAVMKKGGKWFRVAVQLKPGARSYKTTDMPMIWTGEFNSDTFNIMDLINQGKIRIVDDSVQREFWRR